MGDEVLAIRACFASLVDRGRGLVVNFFRLPRDGPASDVCPRS